MAEDLNQELQSAGVAATCCPSIEDLLGHDDLQSRGFWRSVRHSVIGAQWIGSLPFVSSPAIELSDIGGPILGEHTVEVLQNWLAMGPEDIERFESVAAFGNTNVQ
jgi:crotonobetainyl-CoA:carnitine CoA-transferase CaiB-like acyl-CoA transferase